MNVLVVDDEPVIRRLFAAALEPLGMAVTCENSGFNALVRVKDQPYDLIFMDILMPGLNGIWAIEEIQRLRPGSRIIAITGHASDDVVDKALEVGAESCMYKPFDRAQIVEVAERVQEELASLP